MTNSNKKLIAAIIAAIALAYTPVSAIAPAHAYDDDIDVVCTENDAGETICESVDDLKVECPLSDPDGQGELCGGLEESRPGRSDWFLAATGRAPSQSDDDRGDGSTGPTDPTPPTSINDMKAPNS